MPKKTYFKVHIPNHPDPNYPVQRILAGGRITLPKDVLQGLNLKKGDFVMVHWLIEDMTVEIIPARVTARGKEKWRKNDA